MAEENGDLTVRLNVTQERMERLKIGIYRKLQKDPLMLFPFVAHFMVDEGGLYLSTDDALEILDDLELRQIEQIGEKLTEAMEQAAVPNQ